MLPCFNQLPHTVATTLLQSSMCVDYQPGESICYQGNEMTAMFLVLKGRVEVWRKDMKETDDAEATSAEAGKGADAASAKDAASNSREDVTNLAINGPRALPPKSEALVAATAAAAAAAAVDVAEGNKPKRRFGLNMKSALQAVAGILGKKIDTLDPGTVLGHRMTW